MLTNDPLAQWDRESFFHPSTHLAQYARGETPSRIITGGEGVHIADRDGHRLLDAFAGLYCVNVGYGRNEIADAIAAQARELAYYHAYVGHGTEAVDHARPHDPRARARRHVQGLLRPLAARTPTRPTSSWSGTTTTSSAARRRRRSSPAGAAITAPA